MLKLHVATEKRIYGISINELVFGGWGGIQPLLTVGPLLACWQRITSSRLKLTRLGQGACKLGHHQQLPSDARPAASQNMRYAPAGNYSQSVSQLEPSFTVLFQ